MKIDPSSLACLRASLLTWLDGMCNAIDGVNSIGLYAYCQRAMMIFLCGDYRR
jgi:hypothetical protein